MDKVARLGYASVMQLSRYLTQNAISSSRFAAQVGVTIHAVRKWRRRDRMPRPDMISKIQKATNNQVKPKDWY